jgi:hypothetical protein
VRTHTRPPAFDQAMTPGEAEPAVGYLAQGIAPGTPLWQSVEVERVGHIRIRRSALSPPPRSSRRPGVHLGDERTPGPVIVYDRSRWDRGMRWPVRRAPVVSTDGPDKTRSAAGRLAPEMPVSRDVELTLGRPGAKAVHVPHLHCETAHAVS